MIMLRNITKRYPGTLALDDVCIEIEPGKVHGIVGENGAGKSTLMNVLSGSTVPTSGSIELDGKSVQFESPATALAHGVSLVSQEGNLVPNLTAAENICLGSEPTSASIINRRKVLEHARNLQAQWFPETPIELARAVSELPYADQKVIEILRALHSSPKVLILDEPTATLPAKEKQNLWNLIKSLPERGVAVILISHFLQEVIHLCNFITVLRDGKIVANLDNHQHDVTEHKLINLMLNRSESVNADAWEEIQKTARQVNGESEEVIQLSEWSSKHFSIPSLSLRRGEILGLIGLTGSGHTEFARSLFEPRAASSGVYGFLGQNRSRASVRQMKRAGAALIPDHRMINSLVAGWSVRENMSIARLMRVAVPGICVIRKKKERSECEVLMHRLRVKSAGQNAMISVLSGGNKQKVSIAKWQYAANDHFSLFVFIEPTEGVDVGAKREIHDMVHTLARNGAAVVVSSSDLLEVGYLADRVIPFRHGAILPELRRTEFNEQAFIGAIAGEQL